MAARRIKVVYYIGINIQYGVKCQFHYKLRLKANLFHTNINQLFIDLDKIKNCRKKKICGRNITYSSLIHRV